MGIDKAIEKLNNLMTDRNHPSWWSENISDASKLLECKRDWTLFYAYLADKNSYDPEKEYVTMGDVDITPIPDLHPELEEIIYMNGDETIIHVRRKVLDTDDEKSV